MSRQRPHTVISLIYVWAFFCEITDAVVHLNLKSTILSRFIRSNEEKSAEAADAMNTPTSMLKSNKQSSNPKDFGDVLRVNLSGNAYCHVLGPPNGDDSVTPFWTTSDKHSLGMPTWIMGVRYDFGKRWYGVNHWMTLLRWQPRRKMNDLSLQPSLRPSCYDLSFGKDLKKDDLHIYHPLQAVQIKLQWLCLDFQKRQQLLSLSGRLHSNGNVDTCLQLPFSNRFRWHGKLTVPVSVYFDEPMYPLGSPQLWNTLPSVSDLLNGGTWIPDLSIDPTGCMESLNNLWIKSPWQLNTRLGVRLVARRRFSGSPWLGTMDTKDQEPEPRTQVRLEVSNIGLRTTHKACLETHLETPVASMRLLLVSSHICNPILKSTFGLPE
jgi:hypothetical protein